MKRRFIKYPSNITASSNVNDGGYQDDWDNYDMFCGKKYWVSGSNGNYLSGDENISPSVYTDDPAEAIEAWFKINSKFPMESAIRAQFKSDACYLIEYAADNLEWVLSLCSRYRCHYTSEFLKEAILDKQADGCRSFYESEFGDMIYPFDVG